MTTDELTISFTYTPDGVVSDPERLDVVLAAWAKSANNAGPLAGYSRSKCAKLIEAGRVRVDNQVILRASQTPLVGTTIYVSFPQQLRSGDGGLLADASIKFAIVFEDADVVVINKPPGLVVHPGAGQEAGTLVEGLLAHCGETIRQVGAAARPGIVHRLDKDTTGLMVVAKTEAAYQDLIAQFRSREISREYLALTIAVPRTQSSVPAATGEISSRLARSDKDRTKFVTSRSKGKEAQTKWEVRERFNVGAVLALRLATGRTHQIRVHLASVGATIVGDQTYGPPPSQIPVPLRGEVKSFGRQALHAARLKFRHPRTSAVMEFSAEPPPEMLRLIELFRKHH